MTSKFKDPTGNIPPSSSGGSTGAKGQPSEPSARTGGTPPNMTTTGALSKPTKPAANSEKVLLAADTAKMVLNILEANGLIRRFKVLSKDRTTVKAIVVTFDNTFWNEDLTLKDADNTLEVEK